MATTNEPKNEVSSSTSVVTKSNIKIVDDDKNTTLHYLASCGMTDKISTTSINKQKIDIENYLGWTPLMMACKNGFLDTVKLLLDYGADPSRKNKFGVSVFLISIASGNLDIVTMILHHLLSGGISKRSLQSVLSPLSVAVLFRNHSILQFLISQNFNVNGVTPRTGITPLMFAVAMDDDTSFTILTANKADHSCKNYSGLTVADIKKSREVKEEKPAPTINKQSVKQQHLTPAELISKSPHMSPFTVRHFVSPQPFLVWPPEQAMFHMRKSSNASPACFIATPHLTPIGMTFVPQIFFPPDFNPNNSYNTYNELLNSHISQLNVSEYQSSPSINPSNGFPSSCV